MKILNLTENSKVYTSNVFLVLGDWNALPDINTLVDVGRDPAIIEQIRNISTGIGKKRIEQVVLTHSHYDHAGLLSLLRATFKPVVYAFSPYLERVDHVLNDGDMLKLGDSQFEVIHTPGHSQDSICLYGKEERVLFVGDTPVIIHRPGDTYEDAFVTALERICQKDVRAIYFGHGRPLLENCQVQLRASLENVRKHG